MKSSIGIFDSGIGGLTVVKQLKKILPEEHLIYFGDTARIPYGTRSQKLIKQYAMEDASFLLQYDIKILAAACNSVSSTAIPYLQERLDIPVLGVVRPGAEAAAEVSKRGNIGVIGTTATINSGSYEKHIKKIKPDANVYSKASPLLVSLVEEGWLDNEITLLTLEKYLAELKQKDIDTLILGCTHYPLLRNAVQKVMGENTALIDSGEETAKVVRDMLIQNNMLNSGGRDRDDMFFVSDSPDKFREIGSRFYGSELDQVVQADFEEFLTKAV